MIISAIARRKRKNLENNWKMFLIPQKLMDFGCAKKTKVSTKSKWNHKVVLGILHQNLQQNVQFIHQKDLE